jgi:hypothetical protein
MRLEMLLSLCSATTLEKQYDLASRFLSFSKPSLAAESPNVLGS